MNSMLYIIAALIIILIVVVLVLIRKKAQQPSESPQLQNEAKAKDTTPKPVDMAKSTPAASADSNATKFDSLTVAQRFMDQQRYDKAIETLERGLIAKPNDSKILLKLLNIYAITDEEAEFNNTFALITAHADSETIQQAKNLKGLVDEEFEQEQAIMAPTDTDESDADYASLDFDLPIASTQTAQPTTEAVEELAPIATPSASEPVNVSTTPSISEDDAFDLLLDDLEEVSPVTQAPDTLPTATANDMPVLDSVIEAPVTPAETNTYAADNIDDDFSFNFDDLSEDASAVDIMTDSAIEAPTEFDLSEDAFVLDFEDLSADTALSMDESAKDSDTNTNTDISSLSADEHDLTITAPVAQESLEDDFALFLDDAAFGAIDEPTTASPSTTEAPIDSSLEHDFLERTLLDTEAVDNDIPQSDSLQTKDLATEAVETAVLGSSVEDTIAQLDALTLNNYVDNNVDSNVDNNIDSNAPIIDAQPEDNVAANLTEMPVSETVDLIDSEPVLSKPVLEDNDSTLTFDDDTEFEDLGFSFDTEAPVAAPVSTVDTLDETIQSDVQTGDIQPSDTVPVTSISPQFSADFDFIKTLDSQQVTLDLAEQYLQLGEYGSAKRLLNEVMTQGTSAQQQQAKALLARTA